MTVLPGGGVSCTHRGMMSRRMKEQKGKMVSSGHDPEVWIQLHHKEGVVRKVAATGYSTNCRIRATGSTSGFGRSTPAGNKLEDGELGSGSESVWKGKNEGGVSIGTERQGYFNRVAAWNEKKGR